MKTPGAIEANTAGAGGKNRKQPFARGPGGARKHNPNPEHRRQKAKKPGTNSKDAKAAAEKALQDKWDALDSERKKLIGSFEQFKKDEVRRQKQ